MTIQIEEKKNGLVVTSKMIGTVVLILGLITTLGNLWAARVLADNEIKVHTQKISELSQTDKNIVDLINIIQKQIAVNENKVDNVKSDVMEIKRDIKDVLRAVKA